MTNYYKNLMDRKAQNGDEGFTLIELLIVIVVLGVLAAVVVFALGSVTGNAHQSACAADAKTVETAVGAYNAQFTPPIAVEVSGTAAGSVNPGTPASYSTATQAALLLGGTSPLLKSWPTTQNGYAISLSTTVAGNVSIYIPPTSITPISFETETSTTGCNSAAL